MASDARRRGWEREYRRGGVSTSRKVDPSHGAVFFLEHLAAAGTPSTGRLLDLGCGTGRNALLFARAGFSVIGMDIALGALAEFRRRVAGSGLDQSAECILYSIGSPFPLRTGTFRVAGCFTSMENLVDDAELETLKLETWRVLSPGGLICLYFLTPQDGFYRPLVGWRNGRCLVTAPDTGLHQRLYEEAEVEALFADRFRLRARRSFRFLDDRFGRVYQRELAGAVLERRD